MATTITNNGASIKIDNGVTIRNLMKNQIIEVSVIKTNTIKIDKGEGALNNVFINYADVTAPVTANAGELRDAINDMMANSVNSNGAGGATEAKQDIQIAKQDIQTTKLTSLDTTTSSISTKVNSIESTASSINTKVTSIDTTANTISNKVNSIDSNAQSMKVSLNNLDNKLFYDPVIVDESNPNIVYYGYVDPLLNNEANPVWAIMRVTNDVGIKRYKWADGNKNFDNIWNNRETLTYQ